MIVPTITFSLLLNFVQASDPVFKEQTIDNNISIGYGLALGDVDGDGKPDILLADKKQFVWYRNGDWKKFVMAENLTEYDNVSIAAQDVDGDGKVEVAVGAQWNPSETTDQNKSGAVYYLVPPPDRTHNWKAVKLYHEPTIHRMGWLKSRDGKYGLVVLPLHGGGNKDGKGEGVNVLMYKYPQDVNAQWPFYKIKSGMHLTHNFEIVATGENNGLYLAGKEGIMLIGETSISDANAKPVQLAGMDSAAGEVRFGKSRNGIFWITIEPMHGQNLVVYSKSNRAGRLVIDDDLKEGHALAAADFLGAGSHQVVAGWRSPNKTGKVGVKLYVKNDAAGSKWVSHWIDENGMACEDIKVMDMDGDGNLDIVASGRSTHNVKIYWNKSAR